MAMLLSAALLLLLPGLASATATSCTSALDCSLNGVCTGGACVCDKPWGGTGCGVLQYKMNQPVTAKNLYTLNETGAQAAPASGPCVTPAGSCPALDTWNGPIVDTTAIDGKFHMFNPLYRKGSLLATVDMMYGTARNITGPYTWESFTGNAPDSEPPSFVGGPQLGENMGSNPAFVTYVEGSKTKFALFASGVHVAEHVAGPYTKLEGCNTPGGNPAPIYHKGAWYATYQQTDQIVTTPALVPGCKWTHFSAIEPKLSSGTQEDPFMYVDKRGNWHIINHAYDTGQFVNCGNSTLSAHSFSSDEGKTWHMLKPDVEPYTHEVHYEDGTSHIYNTLERPNAHFNAAGEMTHINLAADLMAQDAGCVTYAHCPAKRGGKCACTNCKYADHAGSIIIALDV